MQREHYNLQKEILDLRHPQELLHLLKEQETEMQHLGKHQYQHQHQYQYLFNSVLMFGF